MLINNCPGSPIPGIEMRAKAIQRKQNHCNCINTNEYIYMNNRFEPPNIVNISYEIQNKTSIVYWLNLAKIAYPG